ncbi:MAG: hypothetical protein R8K22_00205 [Mariprofundaceae bacterium]
MRFCLSLVVAVLLPITVQAAYNPEHKADKHFARLDVNKDNSVSKEEFMKRLENRFLMIDTDANDEISIEELNKYWVDSLAEYEKFKHKNDDYYRDSAEKKSGEEEQQIYTPKNKAEKQSKELDSDHNNVVTKEEFLRARVHSFKAIDQDESDYISLDELRFYWHHKNEKK